MRAAAAELNYSPNANAQAIVRGTTSTVGLIVHDIADPSAAALASGVMAAAAERDLIVTIASTLSDPFTEIRHVEALRRQRARAVILAGSRFNDAESAERLAEELLGYSVGGGHVAVIGQHSLPLNTVVVDNAGGATPVGAGAGLPGLPQVRRAGRPGDAGHLRGPGHRIPAGAGRLPVSSCPRRTPSARSSAGTAATSP